MQPTNFWCQKGEKNPSDKLSELSAQLDVYIVIYLYKSEMRFLIYMKETCRSQYVATFYIQVHLSFTDNWHFGGLNFDGHQMIKVTQRSSALFIPRHSLVWGVINSSALRVAGPEHVMIASPDIRQTRPFLHTLSYQQNVFMVAK